MCSGAAPGEGAVEVCPEVFDVLAADAESQQRRWQVFLAGDGGATLDGADLAPLLFESSPFS